MTTRDPDSVAAQVVGAARALVGQFREAGTLIVEAFAAVGIALEDDLLVLHLAGEKIVGSELLAADLIFRTGRQDRYHPGDTRYGVGHVGIYTGVRTVLHASPVQGRVLEDEVEIFFDFDNGRFRGVRRLIARA